MVTAPPVVTWSEAVRGFVLHKKAVRSPRTAIFYRNYATNLANWADSQNLPLDAFTKRHLDEFLVYRAEQGRSQTTPHHDALVATVLFEWCKRNDLLDRDPLAEYKVRNAPSPHKYMPSADDVQKFLQALLGFYDPAQNPEARFCAPAKRSFYRDRNYAVELVKLDTACRIGEILNFKVLDYQTSGGDHQLAVREAKGREPRILPVSRECAQAIDQWLKIRRRIMSNAPECEDEGWLFVSETGGRMNEGNYLRGIKKVLEYGELPKGINNHSQRRFSLNNMAKDENGGLLFAQGMAGHKDPKTTLIYLKIDGDYLRERHEKVGVVRGILHSNRSMKRKRLV